MRLLIGIVLLTVILGMQSSKAQEMDVYCETGDPAGVGPNLSMQIYDKSESYTADVSLNIHSVYPEYGAPNTSILRNNLLVKDSVANGMEVYEVKVTENYGIILYTDREDYSAEVVSLKNKFDPIWLSCDSF
ncbi:MAG: hypothetical protein H6621_07610 [Halobacteriovoraceae bacterium]|nr:hypothetical protein [Halobacteriovoraceae bacterium]